MHEKVTVAVEIMPYTRRPALGLALEAEVRVLELQRPVDLLQRHWRGGFGESIKYKNRIVIRRLSQVFRCIRRLWWIIGRR